MNIPQPSAARCRQFGEDHGGAIVETAFVNARR
jgi:hypothetical protein